MKIINQEVERLCIGNDIYSILFSHHHTIPIIFYKPHAYSKFHLIENVDKTFVDKYDLALNCLYDSQNKKEYNKYSCLEIIEKAATTLSSKGLFWPSYLIKNIRIEKEKSEIDIILSNNHRVIVKFKKLFFLNQAPYNFLISEEPSKEKRYEVHDYLKVLCVRPHEVEFMRMEDNFVNEIHFHNTIYKTTKDVVSISYLTEQQIESGDYETYHALFKTKKILKEYGITGKLNKYDKKRNKIYFLDLKMEHVKRIIYETFLFEEKYENDNIFYNNIQNTYEILETEIS